MKLFLCSFGDKKYERSLNLLKSTALEIGKVDEVFLYTPKLLSKTEFWIKNQFILSRPRGAGYWIWKPYIMLETFSKMNDGDVLMYVDAGVRVTADLTPLKEIALQDGYVLFDLGFPNKVWTKRDCFVLMNADEQKYWDGGQTNAFCQFYVKNEQNTLFIKEYLKYCRDARVVTDDINLCGKPNFLGFKDHRHDQSILSILTIKYGLKKHADPSQYGEENRKLFNSPYGQLLYHHRNFKH